MPGGPWNLWPLNAHGRRAQPAESRPAACRRPGPRRYASGMPRPRHRSAPRGDRLHDPGLVIGEHQADQPGVGAQQIGAGVDLGDPVSETGSTIHRSSRERRKFVGRASHRRVLDGRHDHVAAGGPRQGPKMARLFASVPPLVKITLIAAV